MKKLTKKEAQKVVVTVSHGAIYRINDITVIDQLVQTLRHELPVNWPGKADYVKELVNEVFDYPNGYSNFGGSEDFREFNPSIAATQAYVESVAIKFGEKIAKIKELYKSPDIVEDGDYAFEVEA